jgi:serine/threonine-protein kinase
MPIGAGGMGRVWAARRLNSPTHQFVAVKTALDELGYDAEFEKVFVDEARIASSIVHPNVCTIYEMGVERSIPYLVMEWVAGGSLHDVLSASDGRKLDYFLAARIIANVCSGLHAAHELTDLDGTLMNVVHRDVSPQNILISEYGHVKIVDFGVARAKGQLHKPTETGELKGKLSYMAPEQLTSKTFDRRADLFALGCVLFQSTTGKRPFHGNDALETMYKLLETECEPPHSICPDFPEALEAIICKSLAKDVELRYQTAEQFERDLDKFLTSNGRLITDRDIAQVVASTLSAVITRRTESLRYALESVNHPNRTVRPGVKHDTIAEKIPHDLSKSDFEKSNDVFANASDKPIEFTANTRGAWESFRPRIVTYRVHRSPSTWLVLGIVTAIASTGGWFALSNRSLVAKSESTLVTNPAANAKPAETVSIRIRTTPPDAILRLDGRTSHRGSYTYSSLSSPLVHEFVIGLEGYESKILRFAFDTSRDEVIELSKLVKSEESELPNTTRPATRILPGIKASVAPTPNSSAVAKSSEPSPIKNRKPKRSLDPTNPFSEP